MEYDITQPHDWVQGIWECAAEEDLKYSNYIKECSFKTWYFGCQISCAAPVFVQQRKKQRKLKEKLRFLPHGSSDNRSGPDFK